MLVISEPTYAISSWYAEILSGLKSEARKKRVVLDATSKIDDIQSAEEDFVIIIGSSFSWLFHVVCAAQHAGKHPIILSNQQHNSFQGKYSYVSADIPLSMLAVMNLFESNDRRGVALYGVNLNSISDICRVDSYASLHGSREDVFYNNGSLSDCFETFYPRLQAGVYDAIICANDYAAVSLLKHLRKRGKDVKSLFIVSYSNTILSGCCTPSISSISMDFESFGQAAFQIVDCLLKNPFITGMHISLDWKIIFRDTMRAISPSCRRTIPYNAAALQGDGFYHDEELLEMMRIEKLLVQCDEVDLKLLSCLMDGKSQEESGEMCYLTENASKYRYKKMKNTTCVATRAQLKSLLEEYAFQIGDR